MAKIEVGMLVLVIHCDDEAHRFLIGQVGTVEQRLSTLSQMLTNCEWLVNLPSTQDIKCPNCNKLHKEGLWPFNSHELRPLIDPDEADERITEQELDEELVT